MRTGILFFFNMGFITKVARTALLPLLVMMIGDFYVLSPFKSVILSFFWIALFISMIPAPPDRAILRLRDRFYAQTVHVAAEIVDVLHDEIVLYLNGYQKKNTYNLCRQIKAETIYTTAACVAYLEKGGEHVLIVGQKSLISKAPATFKRIPLSLEHPVEIRVKEQDEGMIDVEFLSLPGVILEAKLDYHYRTLIEALGDYARVVEEVEEA